MPFIKGRVKTGGRVKGGPKPKSTRLIDQLKNYGFNYVKRLAFVLASIGEAAKDPVAYKAWLAEYSELKALLPYMAPKLVEREVELVDASDLRASPEQKQISDEDLIKAMNNGAKQSKPRASHTPPVEKGNPQLQDAGSPKEDLHNLAGE